MTFAVISNYILKLLLISDQGSKVISIRTLKLLEHDNRLLDDPASLVYLDFRLVSEVNIIDHLKRIKNLCGASRSES